MIVSQYIIKRLVEFGVKYVFGITGTAVNMLFVSLGQEEGIDYICPLHEQTASMGADGYSRVTGQLGVAVGTSGPGTSNMLTGCAGAFSDSVPVLYIVGQTGRFSSKGNTNVRFFGFQELESENVFRSVTKYICTIEKTDLIKFELEKAVSIATSDRKGPVMLVIPEDILYAEVNPTELKGYHNKNVCKSSIEHSKIEKCYSLLKEAKRPIILYGAGVHNANAEVEAREMVRLLDCPVGMSYPARDLFDTEYANNIGSIGIFGSRYGNFAVQTSDLLFCIGIRLDKYVTGNPSFFASGAKKVIVDIEMEEIKKLGTFGITSELEICGDAKDVIEEINKMIKRETDYRFNFEAWKNQISKVKKQFPFYEKVTERVIDPYNFIKCLSTQLKADDIIFSDTGLSTVWMGQAFDFKEGQRWFTQFSFSSMGYALPGAFGASFADDKRIICLVGDGGLQMSIQELATVMYYGRNIKIFVICNNGYGLIQKTQDDYNNGHYASDSENHVPFPDIKRICKAYSVRCIEIFYRNQIESGIQDTLNFDGTVMCLVHIPIEKKIVPRIKGNVGLEDCAQREAD